jgi:hypothetical protein
VGVPQPFESSAPPQQQPASRDDVSGQSTKKLGRLMVGQRIPALLTPAELRDLTAIDRTTFRKLQLAGDLDWLVVDLGPRRFYSGARLVQAIEGIAADVPAAEERAGEGKRRFLAAARRSTARQGAVRKTHARHDTRLER